jgi:hypothetical protein
MMIVCSRLTASSARFRNTLFQDQLALSKCLFGLLLGFDVGARPEPADNLAALVPKRQRAAQVPAIAAIEPSEPVLDLERRPRSQRLGPPLQLDVDFVGMQDVLPSPAQQLIRGHSRVLEATLVVVLDIPVRTGDPHEMWKCVGEVTQILVA